MTTNEISWRPRHHGGCLLLAPRGVLDARTYRDVRDDLVKFAVDEPRAVIVLMDDLVVESAGSLTAFSSAWMRIGDWPAVPIMLVARDAERCRRLCQSAMARFVPVYGGVDAAAAALRDPPARRRTEVELFPVAASSRLARVFVRRTCEHWDIPERAPGAAEVASELVENAIIHAGTDLWLRLELRHGLLTFAVRDGSRREAVLRERTDEPAGGLRLVAYLCRAWGCVPDARGGKVVWAVLAG